MRTTLLPLLTGALVTLTAWLPSTAEAGVVYRWVNQSQDAEAGALQGELVVRDSAWFSGMTISETGFSEYFPTGPSAVESFWFKGPSLNLDYQASSPPSFSSFMLDITLGNTITGNWLGFNTSAEDVLMYTASPSSDLWTIEHLGTDFDGSPCFNGNTCQGGTGYWALDLSTLPVSSPGSLPLLALGLAALAWRQRAAHSKA